MSIVSQPVGRRERNKQQKLDRIIAAASELFTDHDISEVTTQQIAEKADIGAGTLFLYAKTKAELLLLVQNVHYASALERGRADAEALPDVVEAVLAIVRPIVACNRANINNGRIYLREMVFGDPGEPHHGEALAIAAQTQDAIATVLRRDESVDESDATTLARIVAAAMFLTMAGGASADLSDDDIVDDIRQQVSLLFAAQERVRGEARYPS